MSSFPEPQGHVIDATLLQGPRFPSGNLFLVPCDMWQSSAFEIDVPDWDREKCLEQGRLERAGRDQSHRVSLGCISASLASSDRERRTRLRAVLLCLSQRHRGAVLVPLGTCSEQEHGADKRAAELV